MQSKFILVALVALVASAQCRTILQDPQQPPPPPTEGQQQPPPPSQENQDVQPQFAKGPVPPECQKWDAEQIECNFNCPEGTYDLTCECEGGDCTEVKCNVGGSTEVISKFDFVCANARDVATNSSMITCNNQDSLDKVGALNQACAPPQIYNAINLWNPQATE